MEEKSPIILASFITFELYFTSFASLIRHQHECTCILSDTFKNVSFKDTYESKLEVIEGRPSWLRYGEPRADTGSRRSSRRKPATSRTNLALLRAGLFMVLFSSTMGCRCGRVFSGVAIREASTATAVTASP